MSLLPGTRLGVYEVVSALGAGGMGEVFRAIDTQLGRNVAIKVLPADVAQDAERLARFDREARTLASLNHPNIAQIYGLVEGRAEAGLPVRALVMELVEGPTLAERVALGAMPVEEALAAAGQIAAALEAAHEQNIIHRDLKPANIKIRPDGTVKVLDFGLAKAMEPASALRDSPGHALPPSAITSPAMMTGVGMILGTAAYMAPEQASGRMVDKRADIWAFGVVLWEMLAGRALFEGETISHVLAAVLTKEADLTAVPDRVRHLLTRCLERDPKKRLRDIGDAMSLVRGVEAGASGATVAVARSRRWFGVAGWAAAGVLATALAAAAWWWPAAAADGDQPMVLLQIQRTPDVYNRTATAFAVSPDGLLLAYYAAGPDGPQTLLVRTLATGEVRTVAGSLNATPQAGSLFWSPDSRQLVRGTASGAHVFDVTTGATRPLCDCRYLGGSWNRDGTILLGSFGAGGISRLSLTDPTAVDVTKSDAAQKGRDTWPVFLPDGRHFLFTHQIRGDEPATFIGTLDGDAPRHIAAGSARIFVPPGPDRGPYLLGIDAAGLVALPFDLNTMSVTGAAAAVVPGAVAASASENGVLAASAAGVRPGTIPTWFDRKGTSLGTVGKAGFIEAIALSPDGRRLAVSEVLDGSVLPLALRQGRGAGQGNEIWLHDLVSDVRTRMTFNGGGTPVWSPDGTRIAFTLGREGNLPFQRAADGTGSDAPLFPFTGNAWTNDWSSAARGVIFSTPVNANVGNDLWFVPMEGATPGKPVPYVVASALQQQAQFSPDGRFVAYGSDQSGTWEIFVQPFPNAADGKWMISSGGGVEPRWSRDGRELFYFSGRTLMAVPVNLQPTFSHGAPMPLFDAPVQPGYTSDSHRWQLAPDATRFLLLANAGKDQAPPLDVLVNWPALLKE